MGLPGYRHCRQFGICCHLRERIESNDDPWICVHGSECNNVLRSSRSGCEGDEAFRQGGRLLAVAAVIEHFGELRLLGCLWSNTPGQVHLAPECLGIIVAVAQLLLFVCYAKRGVSKESKNNDAIMPEDTLEHGGGAPDEALAKLSEQAGKTKPELEQRPPTAGNGDAMTNDCISV